MAGQRAYPARAHGQNFLRSPRLAQTIVGEADVRATDLVLEIGAGSGRLTAPLADSGARVSALEVDPVWAERLRERFAGHANVVVVEADALIAPLPSEPFRVVGNLPFQHTTSILRRLLDDPRGPLQRADVIVQWEVARKRATCWPGTLLGAYWGAWYEFHAVRRLPAACFEPRPPVDAAVLRIVRRPVALVPTEEAKRYHRLLSTAFGRSEVRLDRSLKRVARELGVTRSSRSDELDAHQWAALFRSVRSTE